ncbi:hypothetical protein GQX73_g1350 [Xylaria multiplex]|uniref:Myb-like DNA-binding domain-containing protein n=1 Tax=Xylaria multiplex TaxID=323545 RepID=A0A7C8IX55_9PEZI|nr:hypothetical protein GQX73_g1350 [Xylaria multiplex]
MPTGTATDTDSQFRFLISCIRHSTAGKVDFEEVRKECEIVSKGAAAKRYERLMKAHNITTGTTVNGVKKEAKGADETKKANRAVKKRKLEEVNEDEGDTDEPIKAEPRVKGEVKNEDAIVKPECANSDTLNATPLHSSSSQSEPTLTSTNTQTDDDDDEVLFVSATEKRSISEMPTYFSDHRQSQVHSPFPAIPGIQSMNYAANKSFPQQLAAPHMSPPPTPTMATTIPTSSFPYGFTPNTWVFPHESHDYI